MITNSAFAFVLIPLIIFSISRLCTSDVDYINGIGQSKPYHGKYAGKIAFMFLSKGELHHEHLWKIFFTWHAPSTLHSIYWHPGIDYIPPPHSFFADKIIPHRVQTDWGGWSLVDAYITLIREAFKDPENEYFFLLSESCIPLVPFSKMYRTLMPFKRYSLINACPRKDLEVHLYRWSASLDLVPGFSKTFWRKSSQFSVLNRKHAALVVDDKILAPAFANGTIIPDEHYVATLLAWHKVSDDTTCTDGSTHIVWEKKTDPHLKTYTSEMIGNFHHSNSDFITHIRNTCSDASFHYSFRCTFATLPPSIAKTIPTPANTSALKSHEDVPCHFLGRKFAASAKYQLLYQSASIFRDEVYNLSLTWQDVFHHTVHRHLRYDAQTNQSYLIDGHVLYSLKETEYVKYPSDQQTRLPQLTLSERTHLNYSGPFSFLQNFSTIHEPTLYRVVNASSGAVHAGLWLVYGGVRRAVHGVDTFHTIRERLNLSIILNIPVAAYDRLEQQVNHILVDPPLHEGNVHSQLDIWAAANTTK